MARLTAQSHAHGQRLSCSASNEAGPAPAEAELVLDVHYPSGPPRIEGLESPQVRAGETLKLLCVVQGGNPPPSLYWDKDGEPLGGSWVMEGDPPRLSRSLLSLPVTPGDHGAVLSCATHSPPRPPGTTASITLSVIYPPSEVVILGTPTVAENQTVTLACSSAPSNPPARLRWWLGGEELEPTETSSLPVSPTGRRWGALAAHTGNSQPYWQPVLVCTGGYCWRLVRTGGYWSVLLGTGPYRCVLVGTSGYWSILVGTGPYWWVLVHTSAYWWAPVGTGPYWWVLVHTSTGPYRHVLVGTIGYWSVLVGTGPYQCVLVGISGYWSVLVGTSPYWRILGGGAMANVSIVGQRRQHGRPLVCEAGTAGLGTRSASVLLSVTYPPQQLWIESPPPGATFRPGAKLRLSCHARGGNPTPRLSWSKDGRTLKEGAPAGGGAVVSRELLLTLAASDNGATYRCHCATAPGTAPLSAATTLRVLFPPLAVTISATPPEPRPGHTLLLTCLAGPAHPLPTLRWTRRGQQLPGEALPPAPGSFGGVTARSRLRLGLALGDQGQSVSCEASSPELGVTTSATYRLLLRREHWEGLGRRLGGHWEETGVPGSYCFLLGQTPPQLTAGGPVVALEHSGVLLPLEVQAQPPLLGCSWSLGGRSLQPEGSPRHRLAPGGSLEIANVSRGDAGTYGVSCHNQEGTASAQLQLLVHYPPALVRLPDPVVVDEGDAAELLCEAEGNPLPPGALRWSRLAEEAAVATALPPGLELAASGPVGRLRVRKARRELGGAYECSVDTGVPPPARGLVRLLVRYPPELEAEPGAEPLPVLVADRSETAELRCRAQGVPGVELHWERRGHALDPTDPKFQQQQWREGRWASSVLTVANLSQERAWLRQHFLQAPPPARYHYLNWEQGGGWEGNQSLGTFICVAQNLLGTARRRFQLLLADRPEAPQDLRVLEVTPRSLSLAWAPGFHGGLAQSFVVSIRGPGAPPPPRALLAPGPSLTLGGLQPATPYEVSVRGRNARGEGPASSIRVVTSAELPQDLLPGWVEPATPIEVPVLPPPALLGALGALGGLLLAALGGLGGALWWRRHCRGRGQGAQDKEVKQVKAAKEESEEPSSPPSWVTSSDLALGELHPYEDVAQWGAYEEVAFWEPPITNQGELV
ncbi:LOW QUALITY PROTEIN: nephrin [Melanerpes formicivorus]|uniref:LOW QUALITY PROTEIN: nephrin n=1 Tax=Melanerpes formicivorus TaxID=211600 RepID=UPI00358EF85D